MKRILFSLAIFPATYAAFAFIIAEANPMEWDSEARAMLLFIAIPASLLAATYPGFYE